jgi:hypothetical protein
MTLEDRAASAAARWAAGVARRARGRVAVDRSRWLLTSSRAVLDRSRPPIQGGQDPADCPASIRTRLLGLIHRGLLPVVIPRRMFIGPCRETHPCTACGMDIETGAQEFDWTNAGNLTLFFHRRCAEIYRTLNDGHGGG